MKRLMIASLSTLLGVASASAADLPTHKAAPYFEPAQRAFDWTGFYAGVNGGVGWGTFGSTGGVFGGTVGYNYQIGQIVIGAEADFDAASLTGKASYPLGVYQKTRLESLTTERLRLGYAMDRTLFYVTGGYAGGSVHQSLWDVPNGLFAAQDNWSNGYAVGGGVEYAFNSHISAKAEYLYTQLTSQSIAVGPDSVRAPVNASLFRVGLNYRF